jgi:hypothetical protein
MHMVVFVLSPNPHFLGQRIIPICKLGTGFTPLSDPVKLKKARGFGTSSQ